MKKTLMGNHAVAVGAKLAKVDVVAAYPITPQTQSVELIAEMQAKGEFKGRYIKVESEHSAMAALIGAAIAGARTFTSTSSQGLAYMHEMLHWAAGSRLPIVMADVNRGLGAPWILWSDQSDTLSQRDTGWMQWYCADNQEVLDSILLAYRVSEQLCIPCMIILDGFTLSHTYEPVDIPAQEKVDEFLPPYKPMAAIDIDKPATVGSLPSSKDYFRIKRRQAIDMDKIEGVFDRSVEEFASIFGRRYGLTEGYRCSDAETIMVMAGAVATTAKEAVDQLRQEGKKAGLLYLRSFRPFPTKQLKGYAKPGVRFAVLDRSYSQGHHGIIFEEMKSALYTCNPRPGIYGFVAGLGGGDITVELLKEMWAEADAGKPGADETVWLEEAR
ncbi:MAG: pyruvate ferredoxin oxidoreductase [Elusimicrobiota bacterium]